jgi:gluconolactonase
MSPRLATPEADVRWTVVAQGIVSPEGPAVAADGSVLLVSRWTGRVMRVDPFGRVTEVLQTEGKPQAVVTLASGDLLVADAKRPALLRVPRSSWAPQEVRAGEAGVCEELLTHCEGRSLLGPNDLCCTPAGVVYLTDPGLVLGEPGQVLRVDLSALLGDPSGPRGDCSREGSRALDATRLVATRLVATRLVDGLLFPNGITMTADGRFLLVAESWTHRIWRYALEDQGRRLGPASLFHEFPDHYPDGMAFDSEGNLLVALHGSGHLQVLRADGTRAATIPVGGVGCTNVVFGGSDFRTLYVTEDEQQALLKTRWHCPGQRAASRSMAG